MSLKQLLFCFLIGQFIFGSDGGDSPNDHRNVEVAQQMVSAESKRRSEERRLIDAECAPARCKLSINMSALAKSDEFSDIIEDWDEVEALHIRFDGVRVSPTYDRRRRNASDAEELASLIGDAGGGTIAQILFRSDAGGTVEGSHEWEVFDPLWWMWARNRRHYAFTMPLLDLDILSVGAVWKLVLYIHISKVMPSTFYCFCFVLGSLTFGIRDLTVKTTSEPSGCEQNMSATCLDAYLAEFVRELTAPIRALQNKALEDQKAKAESAYAGGGSSPQAESAVTQRPTPAPLIPAERLGRDNSDVICQSGMIVQKIVETNFFEYVKILLIHNCTVQIFIILCMYCTLNS